MAIESNLAGIVRVAYEAVTGEFNRDVDRAARNYVGANEHMSDSALKLELAQDRLRRAIAKGPAAEREQARALLQVRQAERELRAETDRATAATMRQGRELDATSRRATRFGGVMRGLRSGVALATGGLIGATGLVFALRKIREATDEAETAEGRLAVALRNSGIEWQQNRRLIDARLAATSRMSAFDDEQLADVLAKVAVRTRDLGAALQATNEITNVARGRQISLEAATQLWIKASLGQAGQLRRVGLEVSKNATAEELLGKLRQTYAGQAERYARSNAAAQDRYNVQLEESAEIIGRSLAPSLADATRSAADWLERMNRSGELQARVNEAVRVGGAVFRGLADGMRIVKAAAEPVVDALGGIEKAAQLALIVGVVSKVRRAAGSFLPLQGASAATAAKGTRDAAVFGRAWDVATRPRNMVVTTTVAGGGARGTTTTAPAGRGRGFPFAIGFNAPTIVAAAAVSAAGASGARTRAYTPARYPRVAALLAKIERGGRLTANERSAIAAFGGRAISELTPAELATLNANLVGQSTAPGLGGDRDRPNMGRAVREASTSGRRGGNRPTGDGLTPLQRAELALSDAETRTPTNRADDLAAARRLEAIYARRARAEGLKGDALARARTELNAATQRRQAIEQAIADDEREADERDRERRRENTRKRRERAEREQREQREAFEDTSRRRRRAQLAGELGDKRAMREGRERSSVPRRRAGTAGRDPDAISRDELGEILRGFLTSWGDMVDAYYPNIAGGTGTHSTAVLEHLTREQTGVLRDALGRPRVGFNRQLDEAAMLG